MSAISAEGWYCGGRSHFPQILFSQTIACCRAAQYGVVMHLPGLPSVVVPGEGQPVMLCILEMIPHNCRETSDRTGVCGVFWDFICISLFSIPF